MQKTYIPEKKVTISILLKRLFIQTCLAAIIILIFYVFTKTNWGNAYWAIAPVYILSVLRDIFQLRLLELTFDPEKKYILFTCKKVLSKPIQKILKFETARIEEFKSRKKKDQPQKVLRLHFFKNKMEVFELNKYKDGYSYETMKQIVDAAREFSLPIF
jgi:hypothetical protein